MLIVEHRCTTEAELEADAARADSIARCLEPLLRSARRLQIDTGSDRARVAADHIQLSIELLGRVRSHPGPSASPRLPPCGHDDAERSGGQCP